MANLIPIFTEKTGYAYDPETSKFRGIVPIQESPLEPGVFLYPPNVTEVIPPLAKEILASFINRNTMVEGKDLFFRAGDWFLEDIPVPPEPEPLPIEELRKSMVATRYQFKAALHTKGVLFAANNYFLDPNVSFLVKLAWTEQPHWERLSPFIGLIKDVLQLSDVMLDDLFRLSESF